MGVSGAGRPLPEHLDVTALRLTYLVDEAQLRTVIKNETSARLRKAIVELLASERIDRDGTGRVPRP